MRLCKGANYRNAGTVEFLLDLDRNEFFFIEVNPRVQVEHTVTEVVTGIDIVKSQILVAQGHKLHEAAAERSRRRKRLRRAAARSSAGSRPKIRKTISSPITAG